MKPRLPLAKKLEIARAVDPNTKNFAEVGKKYGVSKYSVETWFCKLKGMGEDAFTLKSRAKVIDFNTMRQDLAGIKRRVNEFETRLIKMDPSAREKLLKIDGSNENILRSHGVFT